MLDSILYPTDFSDCSTRAFEYVRALCRSGISKKVVMLHVVNRKRVESMALGVAWFGKTALEFEKEFKERLTREAEENLEKLAEELRQCADVKTLVEYGNPVKLILKTAEEENVSVIIIGSHGRSNFEEVLLGSVSEEVVRKAKVPVLVVKRDVRDVKTD